MRSTMACCRESFYPKCKISGSWGFAIRCPEGKTGGNCASMKHIEFDVVVGFKSGSREPGTFLRVRVTFIWLICRKSTLLHEELSNQL
jgi:hypothetical protein